VSTPLPSPDHLDVFCAPAQPAVSIVSFPPLPIVAALRIWCCEFPSTPTHFILSPCTALTTQSIQSSFSPSFFILTPAFCPPPVAALTITHTVTSFSPLSLDPSFLSRRSLLHTQRSKSRVRAASSLSQPPFARLWPHNNSACPLRSRRRLPFLGPHPLSPLGWAPRFVHSRNPPTFFPSLRIRHGHSSFYPRSSRPEFFKRACFPGQLF